MKKKSKIFCKRGFVDGFVLRCGFAKTGNTYSDERREY